MYNSRYLSETVLPEIRQLQQHGFYLASYVMMMQAIEYLGAILDKKPLKAREQSKKRFAKAIDKLFDSRYKYYNRNCELYDHLRNHLLHTLSAGSYFELVSLAESGERKHLTKSEDGKVILIAEELLEDIEKAATEVL